MEALHFSEYLYRSLQKIERNAIQNGIPLQIHLVQPEMNKRLLYILLGRGTNLPTGNVRYRFCTGNVKIEPMEEIIRTILRKEGAHIAHIADRTLGTLWLAVRNENRLKNMKNQRIAFLPNTFLFLNYVYSTL